MNHENIGRIIKKYPNRRLYDTAVSKYITLEDIRGLVKNNIKFKVVDAKTEEDLTRSILLQLIMEQEEKGQPIFTIEILEQIVRTYGDAMHGFLATYIQESMEVFLKQQKLMQEQMASLIQNAPMTVFSEMARQNLRLWQSMQESFMKSYRPEQSKGGKTEDTD